MEYGQLAPQIVPLVDACDTEWRACFGSYRLSCKVPLVDACDTEWRISPARHTQHLKHVPLVDACDTEWRMSIGIPRRKAVVVPLVDACDTEWRSRGSSCRRWQLGCHSLMPVILNGGVGELFHSV